jgi:hypothetical protein
LKPLAGNRVLVASKGGILLLTQQFSLLGTGRTTEETTIIDKIIYNSAKALESISRDSTLFIFSAFFVVYGGDLFFFGFSDLFVAINHQKMEKAISSILQLLAKDEVSEDTRLCCLFCIRNLATSGNPSFYF